MRRNCLNENFTINYRFLTNKCNSIGKVLLVLLGALLWKHYLERGVDTITIFIKCKYLPIGFQYLPNKQMWKAQTVKP